jgi:hypothetical protein
MSPRVPVFVVALLAVGGVGFGLGAYHRAPAASGDPVAAAAAAAPASATTSTGAPVPARVVVVPRVIEAAPSAPAAPATAGAELAPCDRCGAARVVDPELLAAASDHVPDAADAVAGTPAERDELRLANDELAQRGGELNERLKRGELSPVEFRRELLKLGEERRAKLEKTLGPERAAIYVDTNAQQFAHFAGEMVSNGAVIAPPAPQQ